MNVLLLFFALPVATIIFTIVVQKILRNVYLTSATFFAIYLVLTFSAFDINFLVYAIVYTIISLITAILTEFILRRIEEENDDNTSHSCNRELNETENTKIKTNEMNNYSRRYQCFRR